MQTTDKSQLFFNAVTERDIFTVKDLVDEGIDINQKNQAGKTALHLAVERGCLEMVTLLVNLKADVNSVDNAGCSAFRYSSDLRISKLLIEHGLDVNAQDKNGGSHLFYAVLNGKTDLVHLLLENKADINAMDKYQVTALWTAAAYGKTESLQLLLEKKADVNIPDYQGRTPLYMAAFYGNTQIVELLLKAHADPSIKNKDGLTALEIATQKNHEKIVHLLKKNDPTLL